MTDQTEKTASDSPQDTPSKTTDQAEKAPAKRKRTSEEIQAQREAWLAKRRSKEQPAAQDEPEASTIPEAKGAPVVQARTTEGGGDSATAVQADVVEGRAEHKLATQPDAAGRGSEKAAPARAARGARAAKKPEEEPTPPEEKSRREFLNYIWGATMALLLVQTTGISILFAFPRFREGEFGGTFNLGVAEDVLPSPEDQPVPNDVGKYWLTQSDEGVLALYKVCTHLGCLYKWTDQTNRFECPCHGSKFTKKGEWIEGPAPRNLDRFVIEAVDDADNLVASTDAKGDPLKLPRQGLTLRIDTGQRINGEPHA